MARSHAAAAHAPVNTSVNARKRCGPLVKTVKTGYRQQSRDCERSTTRSRGISADIARPLKSGCHPNRGAPTVGVIDVACLAGERATTLVLRQCCGDPATRAIGSSRLLNLNQAAIVSSLPGETSARGEAATHRTSPIESIPADQAGSCANSHPARNPGAVRRKRLRS